MDSRRSTIFWFYQLEALLDALVFQNDRVFFTVVGGWLVAALVTAFRPPPSGSNLLLLASFLAFVSALWVFINSRRRNANPFLGFVYAVSTFLLPPAGGLLYFCLRPKRIFPKPIPRDERSFIFPVRAGPIFVFLRLPPRILLKTIAGVMILVFFILSVLAALGRL